MDLLSAFLHQHDELTVITLHFPGAGVADWKHKRVARPILVRLAVGLRENQLAAQDIDKFIDIGRPLPVIRFCRRRLPAP
jgi:hypothetical protein